MASAHRGAPTAPHSGSPIPQSSPEETSTSAPRQQPQPQPQQPNGTVNGTSTSSQGAHTSDPTELSDEAFLAAAAKKYRGATVEDLEPPAALSVQPGTPMGVACAAAFERDYSHLTVTDGRTRALMGYVSAAALRTLLEAASPAERAAAEMRPVEQAMMRFRRGRATPYRLITMDTPLQVLEAFFEGRGGPQGTQDFAVVTDEKRRFVLGVATRWDLDQFVRRRPV